MSGVDLLPPRPRVVCLCGSTRFRREYERAFSEEEHAGRVCLTVPCFKDDPCCKTAEDHARLDALHRAKIDMADEILVIAPGGYIGDSTRAEIAYAEAIGKPVRFRPGRRAVIDTLPEALAAVRAARTYLLEAKLYVRPKPAVARGLVAKTAATLEAVIALDLEMLPASDIYRLADNLDVADRDMLACPSMALGYVEGALWGLANLQRRLERGGAAAAEGG